MQLDDLRLNALILDAKLQAQLKGGTDDLNTTDSYIGAGDIDVF